MDRNVTMSNLYDWSGIYPENQEGYKLFEQLESGNPIEITVKGTRYNLQFQGDRFGGNNLLLVTNKDGQQRKYGWGWEPRLVFQALEDMQQGWEHPQMYKYRPMQGVTRLEEV